MIDQRHGEGHGLAVAHQRGAAPGVHGGRTRATASTAHVVFIPPAETIRATQEGRASQRSRPARGEAAEAGHVGAQWPRPSGTDRGPGAGLLRPQPAENGHLATPQNPFDGHRPTHQSRPGPPLGARLPPPGQEWGRGSARPPAVQAPAPQAEGPGRAGKKAVRRLDTASSLPPEPRLSALVRAPRGRATCRPRYRTR